MSVEHVLPSTINTGLVEGFDQPDAVITRFETGGRMARFWSDRVLKNYNARFVPMRFTANDIADLKAFARHIQDVVYPFWVIEPWIEDHFVLCGGPADGTMTTFVLPIRSYTSIYGIYDDDAFVDSTNYTLHTTANLIAADDDANAVDSIGNITNEGGSTTVARYLGDAVDGRACIRVNQAGVANNGLKLASQAVAASTKYTFHIFFKGSGTFKVRVVENDGGTTTTTSTGITGDPSAWQQESLTVTMTGTTTAVDIKGIRAEGTAATWFAGCIAYARGDNTRWFLPSVSPSMVEFDTAPADGSRISAAGKGYRMTRVAIDRGGIDWVREDVGHAMPRTFTCMEVVER
jgi:hypothetical protein